MAKESMKARERKRERLAARYEAKREELTKILKSTDASEEIQNAKWDAGNLASCYQNIIYITYKEFQFKDWNPKVMSYDEHALRMNYEASLRNTT